MYHRFAQIFKMITTKEKYPEISDDELLVKYKASNNLDFITALFFRYANLMTGICLKYLKDESAAQDAVLNIYEDLLNKAKNYNISNFKSWIYSVTKNYCVTFLTKNKHTIVDTESIENIWDDFSGLDKHLEKEIVINQLENCLGQLSKDQFIGIKLFYFENKCYNEIAENTGFEWGKIRSLIQNGKRNLKNCMQAI